MAPKKKSTALATSVKTTQELKALDRSELTLELKNAQKDLYVLSMKKELGELKQTHLMKKGRKYIAQISTFLTSTL